MTPKDTSVVLLAAGRGARMRELTHKTPKPLLKVGEHALIEHHLLRLSEAGFKRVVINTAYLGDQIQQHLGDGARYQLELRYSDESATGALETAGGLRHALTLIDSDPFLVINADIFTDFNFKDVLQPALDKTYIGRLVLVENPIQNPNGDFFINETGISRTFSGIALYRKSLFTELPEGKQALGPILKTMVSKQRFELIEHLGQWTDVGTPERLAELNSRLNG